MAIEVRYSAEDRGYIAVDLARPGCSAWGKTEDQAVEEIIDAADAWDRARAAVSSNVTTEKKP